MVETGIHGENHPDLSRVTDKFYHIMLYRVHLAMRDRHGRHRMVVKFTTYAFSAITTNVSSNPAQ